MNTNINIPVAQQLKTASRIFSVFILLCGISVLTGYQWNISYLKRILPGTVAMNPLTAITFILCGISLMLLHNNFSKVSNFGKVFIIRILAGIIFLIGLLKTCSYLFDFNFQLDTLIFSEKLIEPGSHILNHMAPNTSFCFTLAGIALLFISFGKQTIGQLVSIIIFLFSLFPIIGYWYQVPEFYGIGSFIPMALNTACCFFLVASALLFLFPSEGIMLAVTNNTVGGFTARILLPLAIIFPLTIAYFRMKGQEMGWYGTEFGIALFTISVILLFTITIWALAHYLSKIDLKRKEAEEQIQKLNAELESKVEERTKELRSSEKRLSSIYDTTGDIIFVLEIEKNERYKFSSVNKSFQNATGIPYEAVVGKYVHEIIPEPSLGIALEKYKEAIAEKTIMRWEETSQYPTGLLTGEVSIAPVFDEAGNCIRLIGAVHDITKRKKAEEEINRLNEELEQKVIDRTAQLESVNKELEAFSYSVSHDLRAPLRAVNGYAKILLEDYEKKIDEDGISALQAIMNNSKKMGVLIDDLLAFSRLGRKEITASEINMNALVRTVRDEILNGEEKETEFKIEQLPPALGDQPLIRQVWVNLISNAIKYSQHKPKPMIEIGALSNGSTVEYYVRDNGAGFDMQYYDKLFGVFQRLHSQEEFEGTGIGLAIVQKIISRHNGTVRAEAKINEGACFYFSLPQI